jgi:hypothetical protein
MDMIYLCLGFLRTLSLGGSAMYASSCISKILLQWLQKDLLQYAVNDETETPEVNRRHVGLFEHLGKPQNLRVACHFPR